MQEERQTRSDAGEAVTRAQGQDLSDVRESVAEQVRQPRPGEDESGRRLKGYTRCIFCFDCIPNKEFGDHFNACMRANTRAIA